MSTEGTADERTPGYYRGEGALQPFDVIDAWELDFYEGNAVKCLVRWQGKNGVPDLAKAVHYLAKVIDRARAGRSGAVARHEIAESEPRHIEPIRRPAITLPATAVVQAFGMTDPAADVLHRLWEWKSAGCVACLLQAEQSMRQLLAEQVADGEGASVIGEVMGLINQALPPGSPQRQRLDEIASDIGRKLYGDQIDDQDADDPGIESADSTISGEGSASLKPSSGDHAI
jgi:hypothetical protein